MSIVYLLHLSRPLSPQSPARHYIGFTDDLESRLVAHMKGTSQARFMQVCAERRIQFDLARIWKGRGATRDFERRLKNYKKTPTLCPMCNPRALQLMRLEDLR